ncbi:MAG: molybdopterin-dependent oxidoreductase [Planctomycetota bacterium]
MPQDNPTTTEDITLPPGQQLVAPGKWPVIGETQPAHTNEPWTLKITGQVQNSITWDLDQLRNLPQTRMNIDIHCVTRWSKLGSNFSGVPLQEIIDAAQPTSDARYISFISRSAKHHSTSLVLDQAIKQKTLIALDYEAQPLPLGHGGPIRNIVPGRYFYKSVKWLEQIELLSEDRLGMWEAESGYHNHADPWREERYMSPTIDKRTAAELIRSKNFSGRDLRSIDASDRKLDQLNAAAALLRDARFQNTSLVQANFEQANLSNAHFVNANLNGANFRNADVEGTDFSGADLRGADFTGASLIGASFANFLTETLATMDASTKLPDNVIAPLFPEQLAFVKQQLGQA